MSASVKPVVYEKIDLKRVNFPLPKEDKRTSDFVLAFVNYTLENGKNQVLRIQTPVMQTPFGISKRPNKKNVQVKKNEYTLSLTFKGMEDDENIKMFHEKLSDFDKLLISTAVHHNNKWFSEIQDLDETLIHKMSLYKHLVYSHKSKAEDGTVRVYDPALTLSIPTDADEHPIVQVFDANHNVCQWSDIKPWHRLVAIFDITSIWKSQLHFGTTPKCTHIKIMDPLSNSNDDQTAFDLSAREFVGLNSQSDHHRVEVDNFAPSGGAGVKYPAAPELDNQNGRQVQVIVPPPPSTDASLRDAKRTVYNSDADTDEDDEDQSSEEDSNNNTVETVIVKKEILVDNPHTAEKESRKRGLPATTTKENTQQPKKSTKK